jgi:hypothetical protein
LDEPAEAVGNLGEAALSGCSISAWKRTMGMIKKIGCRNALRRLPARLLWLVLLAPAAGVVLQMPAVLRNAGALGTGLK